VAENATSVVTASVFVAAFISPALIVVEFGHSLNCLAVVTATDYGQWCIRQSRVFAQVVVGLPGESTAAELQVRISPPEFGTSGAEPQIAPTRMHLLL